MAFLHRLWDIYSRKYRKYENRFFGLLLLFLSKPGLSLGYKWNFCFWDAGGYDSLFNSQDAVEQVGWVCQWPCRRSGRAGVEPNVFTCAFHNVLQQTILSFTFQLGDCYSQWYLTIVKECWCSGVHRKTTCFSNTYLVICTLNSPQVFLPSYLVAAMWLFSVYLDIHYANLVVLACVK